MDTVLIEAPEDAFIVSVVPEGRVAVAQKLIELKSPKLEKDRSQLVALEEHLTYIERPFKDGRIDQEIAALGQKEKALSEAVVWQQKVVDAADAQVSIGHQVLGYLGEAKVKMIEAQNSQIDAQLASSHAVQKKVDLLDKIATARNKIARDHQYLNAMDKALTINSGVNGTFYAVVVVGSFVRKGHTLGKINI